MTPGDSYAYGATGTTAQPASVSTLSALFIPSLPGGTVPAAPVFTQGPGGGPTM